MTKKEKEAVELTMMRARGVLSDEELASAKGPVKAEIESLEQELFKLNANGQEKLEKAHRAFNLATEVAAIFRDGVASDKMDILLETGSNLSLKDRNLTISHTDLYSTIIKGLNAAKAINPEFEPKNTQADKDKTDTFVSVCPTLLRG